MNVQALFQQGIFHICSSSNSILFQNNIDLDHPMIDTSRLYHVNTINFSWLVLIIMFVGVECSVKALKQEREYLAKRVSSKLTSRWDRIPLQLVNKLWTNPDDMEHIKESAEIVAKLVGFCESGEQSKEMFELSFANPSDKKSSLDWNLISNLLNLLQNTCSSTTFKFSSHIDLEANFAMQAVHVMLCT